VYFPFCTEELSIKKLAIFKCSQSAWSKAILQAQSKNLDLVSVFESSLKKPVILFLNSSFQTETSNLASKMKTIFLLTFLEIESIF